MANIELTDPYHLERFVQAQDPIYEEVLSELRRGVKESHWMWFIFPQLKGLGFSQRADEFAISSREEAQAYLDHLVLGPRLIQCTQLVIEIDGFKISEIFGYPDYLKFRSCMTLFSMVNPEEPVFRQALQKYFGGELDPRTVARL